MGSSVILPAPGQPREGPDPNFSTGSTPNIVTFKFSDIEPPSALYIQRDDKLQIKIRHSVPGMGYIVSARMLMPIGPLPGQPDAVPPSETVLAQYARGWINVIRQEFFPPSDRTPNTLTMDLAEGYLVSVSVAYDFTLGVVNRGQAFVSVGLSRPGSLAGRFAELIEDDLGLEMDLAWPGGTIRAPTEGPGFIHSVAIANPAAGAEWSFTIPTGSRMRFRSGGATLTTSVAVATRATGFHATDGVTEYMFAPAAQTQAASLTVRYDYLPGSSVVALVGTQTGLSLPSDPIFPAGHVIGSATAALQAGDQWSGIELCVEEWINA